MSHIHQHTWLQTPQTSSMLGVYEAFKAKLFDAFSDMTGR